MKIERLRLLAKISDLYYNEGLSQQEITAQLNISRPQISRMLNEARERGIVKITVIDPFSEENGVADLLIRKYGLKNAVIIDTKRTKELSKAAQVERAAAEYLFSFIKNGDTIVVSPGRAVYGTGKQLRNSDMPDCMVVPLSGGWGIDGDDWQANNSALQMANQLNCKNLMLNAPAVVSTVDSCEMLLKEMDIKNVLERAKHADIALLGIGQISDACTIYQSKSISKEVLAELIDKGACASFASSFLDQSGKEIDVSIKDRMIGLKVSDIQEIPMKIAVSYGENKISAIKSTLSGRRIDAIVTDLDTAKELI